MPRTYKNSIETEIKAKDMFSRSVNRMSKTMGRMHRIAGRTKMALRKTAKAAMFLGRKGAQIAKVGLLAAAGAATALFVSVTNLAVGMDTLAKTARSIDFPIEEFQQWRFAAVQSGVAQNVFDKSAQKFTRSIGELKGGYGSLYAALKKSDPQLLKQLKNTEDISSALNVYLGAIREVPGAGKKAALSAAGFGRAGIDMINLANLSSEAIGALHAEMKENGLVTEAQANKAEIYNDMMNRVKLTLKGVAVDGLTPLMPLMTEGMESIRKWIVNNRELIKQKIENVFKNILKYGKIAFEFLRRNVPPLIDKLKQIGSEGFAWVKENKKELKSFFGMIASAGKMSLKVATFVIRHKEAVLGVVTAYYALSGAMRAIEFANAIRESGKVITSLKSMAAWTKTNAKLIGKGGLLVTAFAAGWSIGSAIFDKWNASASSLALNVENMAARVSMSFHKMSNDQLKATDRTLAAQEKKITSTWESIKAFTTGNYSEHQAAIKAVKDARIKGLSETLSRYNTGAQDAKSPIASRAGADVQATDAAQAAQLPQAQTTRSENVTREKVELTIKDETGRAKVSKRNSPSGLTLAHNGGV